MSVVNKSAELESFKDDLDAEFEVDAGTDVAEDAVYRLTTVTTVTTTTTATVFL